jgi:two-component system sensor histidine kinase BaeS
VRPAPPRWQPRGDAPPWWPEDEPWPPARGDGKKRFLMRVGVFFAVVIGLMFAFSLLGALFGRGGFPGGPLIFLLLLVSLFVMGRALRRTAAPIGEVMAAAERVAGGDYSARVETPASGEVGRLVDTFNGMASRLQKTEESRRALVADVAHELRTPLSVVRGNVEAMLDGVYPRDDDRLHLLLDETAIMTRLLEDLRTLSLSDSGALPLHKEPTDLAALVDDLLTACEGRAAEAGVSLTGRVAAMEAVTLDPVRVRQTLDNLLGNALRHTPRGGSVTIDVRPTAGGEAVRFSVRDTGPGIPPEHLDRVFDRFWKSADSGGSGLGLAIARGLVEAHGGAIVVESAPGKGATFTFTIPCAKQPVKIVPRPATPRIPTRAGGG